MTDITVPTPGQDPWDDTLNTALESLQDQVNAKSATGHTHDYIPTSEKGANSGVASLGTTGLVQPNQLGTGIKDTTTWLRGDSSFQTLPLVDHGATTGRGDDDHPQYLNDSRGDARYYTQAQTDALLAGIELGTGAELTISQVTDLQTTLDTKLESPIAISDTTGLQTALDAKQDTIAAGTYATADDGGLETLQAHGSTGSTETINLANGNVHTATLDADCTLTFSGSTASKACSFTLVVTQDGTGGWVITWPASVKWGATGTAPTLTTTAGGIDVFTFLTTDNGTTWLGFTAGLDFA